MGTIVRDLEYSVGLLEIDSNEYNVLSSLVGECNINDSLPAFKRDCFGVGLVASQSDLALFVDRDLERVC